MRTARDRSHESELEKRVRSLETNSKRLKCCLIVLVVALVIAIIAFSTFICGLLIGATSIVSLVVAIIEKERKELKSDILKRTCEVIAPDQLHQTDTSVPVIHCCAKTDTSDMSEMNCVYPDTFIPRNCPVKTVHVYESPVTSIQTFCPANSSSVIDCLGGINTQLGNNTLAVNCTNLQCK